MPEEKLGNTFLKV